MIRVIIQIILFMLPWSIRRFLMCFFFGFKIHKKARIGFSLILSHELDVGENARIGNLTICRSIDRLVLKENSILDSLNFITGFAQGSTDNFTHIKERRCELIINEHAAITSRHYLDCNAGIYVGAYATIAGVRTQILTHSIDLHCNRQDARSIMIGEYCFVGTGSIILPGANLPPFSVLGAGSVLNKKYTRGELLYAGTPARPVKRLDRSTTAYFRRKKGVVT
jgi:acetyltransferase-like isoleucine patch superfamily enzyme